MLSSDPIQILVIWGDLRQPSWGKYHLFGTDSTNGRPLVTIEPPPLETCSFKTVNGSPSQGINVYEKSFTLQTNLFVDFTAMFTKLVAKFPYA
ncbi:hypothetical protein TNCV_3326221 [Trichonephila clavipes]|nr:hypothetical protein TNCV_3326221 [Trichonephila clavipes]